MQPTQLVPASLESVLGRRIQTLLLLKQRDPELFAKKGEDFPRALTLVAERFRLHIEKQSDPKRALAITLILLNYILECQTAQWLEEKKSLRDPADISMAFWRKFPASTLITSAVQRLNLLIEDIRETWFQARIDIAGEPIRWYGITDAATETILASLTTRQLMDAQGFPIGTYEEDHYYRELLARVKEETRLAKMVDWSVVLRPFDISKFASLQFLRHSPLIPNPAGGVWHPFLCSLMVNAMGGGWDVVRRFHVGKAVASDTERFVVVDLKTMARFLQRIVFEPEILPSPVAVSVNLTKIFIRRDNAIFLKECGTEDINALLAMAGGAFQTMGEQARKFYLKEVKNIDAPDDAELMQFWGHLMFSYVPFDDLLLDQNRTNLEQPWRHLQETRSLEQLADAVVRFDLWPPEERERFSKTFLLEPLLRNVAHVHEDVDALLRIWTGMRRADNPLDNIRSLIKRCFWERRSALAMELCGNDRSCFCVEETREVVRRIRWTFRTIPQILKTPAARYVLKDILDVGTTEYTVNNWETLLMESNHLSEDIGLIIWDHLPPALRPELYLALRPDYLAAWFLVQPSEVFQTFFEQVLRRIEKNEKAKAHHVAWCLGLKSSHRFVPGSQRALIMDQLWKRYLHRSFLTDLRT